MELNNIIGESEHTNSILKIEPGAAVVGAATAGPAGEVERLRGGVGRHGFLLLALVVLKRQKRTIFHTSFWLLVCYTGNNG